MYLETVLKTLDPKANVLVYLNSFTTYGEDTIHQDHCGNHHAENFLTALSVEELEERFTVKSIEAEDCGKNNPCQWIITLQEEKSHATYRLNDTANAAALNAIWRMS